MPILHKNITAEADIHNPKWIPSANNGDVAWKNEKGELESTDELVLPSALDFVDASLAPPTTNTGDIYVLSSGGSVNAGWGVSASLKDWVRYDGTDWNEITPQKSNLCYNENDDTLYSYDGAAWNTVGAADTNFANTNLNFTGNRTHDIGTSFMDISNGGTLLMRINGSGDQVIEGAAGNGISIGTSTTAQAKLYVRGNASKTRVFSAWNSVGYAILDIYNDRTLRIGEFGLGTGALIVGASAVVGSEKISFQGDTLIKGSTTTSGVKGFQVVDSTNASKFEVRNNGDLYTNGTQGLSSTYTFGGGSTGDIASMTFTNGILTAVTTVP